MDRGRLKTSGPAATATSAGDGYAVWKDLALCAWFLVAALGFFGPYLGFVPVVLKTDEAPSLNPLTPAYALFLLLSVLVLALRLLKGRRSAPDAAGARQ